MRPLLLASILAGLPAVAGCADGPPPPGVTVDGGQRGDRFTCTASLGADQIDYRVVRTGMNLPLSSGEWVPLTRDTREDPWVGPSSNAGRSR
jgi:hypothetical protein